MQAGFRAAPRARPLSRGGGSTCPPGNWHDGVTAVFVPLIKSEGIRNCIVRLHEVKRTRFTQIRVMRRRRQRGE